MLHGKQLDFLTSHAGKQTLNTYLLKRNVKLCVIKAVTKLPWASKGFSSGGVRWGVGGGTFLEDLSLADIFLKSTSVILFVIKLV